MRIPTLLKTAALAAGMASAAAANHYAVIINESTRSTWKLVLVLPETPVPAGAGESKVPAPQEHLIGPRQSLTIVPPTNADAGALYRLVDGLGSVRGTLVVYHPLGLDLKQGPGKIFFRARTEVKGPGIFEIANGGRELRIIEPEEVVTTSNQASQEEDLAPTQVLPDEEEPGKNFTS